MRAAEAASIAWFPLLRSISKAAVGTRRTTPRPMPLRPATPRNRAMASPLSQRKLKTQRIPRIPRIRNRRPTHHRLRPLPRLHQHLRLLRPLTPRAVDRRASAHVSFSHGSEAQRYPNRPSVAHPGQTNEELPIGSKTAQEEVAARVCSVTRAPFQPLPARLKWNLCLLLLRKDHWTWVSLP